MSKRTMFVTALMFALVAPFASAHDGHAHKIMGTVLALDTKQVQVKTPSGEILSIALNEKTAVTSAKKKMALSDVHVGGRVVVDIGNGEDPLIAHGIELAAPPIAKTTTAAKAPTAAKEIVG